LVIGHKDNCINLRLCKESHVLVMGASFEDLYSKLQRIPQM